MLFLAVGCVADKPYVPAPAKEVEAAAPVHAKNIGSENGFAIVSDADTALRVAFTLTDAKNPFSWKLAERLAGMVCQDGKVRLVTAAPYDLNIVIAPEFEVIDKDGGYVRIKCTQVSFAIRPMESKSKEIYAVKTIVPAELPRQLGEEKAVVQYVAPVAKEAAPFLEKELERLGNTKLAVTEMKFKLKNQLAKPDPVQLAAQAAKISGVLASMPGVVSAQNVFQDTKAAGCTFRIVYLKEQFPQGIANAINLELAK